MPFLKRKASDRLRLIFILMVLGPSGLSTSGIQSSGESLELWLRLLVPWYFTNLREIVLGSFMIRHIEDRSSIYTKWQKDKLYFENNCFRYSLLESKNSFASFGLGHGGGLRRLIYDIVFWDGASLRTIIFFLIRYISSALLIRVSPAWYAYMMVEDPLEEMREEMDLPDRDEEWDEAMLDLIKLRDLISECMKVPEGTSYISGWVGNNQIDPIQAYENIIKDIGRQLDMWNKPGPCQLVDLHIVTEDSTEVDESYIRLIDE